MNLKLAAIAVIAEAPSFGAQTSGMLGFARKLTYIVTGLKIYTWTCHLAPHS